ncbi:MAG: hypothetical protein IPK82_02760 [Polyangiaceae bacterium]|nr:hypothetical protein [Polyangiaceae bacterium]
MKSLPHDAALYAAVLLFVIAAVQTARLAFRKWAIGYRLGRAREQGRAGEERAEKLLTRQGYHIEARQTVLVYQLKVDNSDVDVELRADFLVRRDRRKFVAEVKTGKVAPRLDTATTRRQLLEYRIAYGVDGVLLVDVENGKIHHVGFPLPNVDPGGFRLRSVGWLGFGIVIGFCLALLPRM